MKRTTFLKTIVLAAAILGGASSMWADTRTWDFTTGSWSTIDASTGTVYYATDGTKKTSTEYDASTAVCMQVTNEFIHNSTTGYKIGGYTTTYSEGAASHDYISIVIPAGYTLKVKATVTWYGSQENYFNVAVGSTYYYAYSSSTDEQECVYANNSIEAQTAYIFTTSKVSSRYINVKQIQIISGVETQTAINENTSWDFTNKPYTETYSGKTVDNVYFGNGVEEKGSYIEFGGNGSTTTGANTVQLKIPANKAVGLIVNGGISKSRPIVLGDGTNTFANLDVSYNDQYVPVTIPSSESERTLYIYTTNHRSGWIQLKRIYAYINQTVSIGSTGWATLYTPCALDFSGVSGLKAYTATCNESTVTLTEVNNVPAGTGIILKGTPNKDYDIPAAGSSSTAKGHLTGAFFTATAYNAFTDPEYTIYALTSENGGATVQFNPITSGEIAAGKAFLKIGGGASSLSRSLNVVFADETTGVVDVRGKMSDVRSDYYNLSGQRVAHPQKGLYIVNGKKVIVK